MRYYIKFAKFTNVNDIFKESTLTKFVKDFLFNIINLVIIKFKKRLKKILNKFIFTSI